MAGRSLYDNQVSLSTVPIIKSSIIDLVPNNKISLEKNKSIDIKYFPPDGELVTLEGYSMQILNPGDNGATLGNISFMFGKYTQSGTFGLMYAESLYNKACEYVYGEFYVYSSFVVPSVAKPANWLKVEEIVKSITVDNDSGLVTRIVNNTNIDLVDFGVKSRVLCNIQKVI